MAKLLYEPTSIRADYGMLYLTEGEACTLPFIFNVNSTSASGDTITYQIQEEDIVEFVIKSNSKSIQPVIRKSVMNIKNNVCALNLTELDMSKLHGKKDYLLSATLVTKNKLSRVLIKKLPVIIQEVA